jgi:hypothetical protein
MKETESLVVGALPPAPPAARSRSPAANVMRGREGVQIASDGRDVKTE